LSDIRFNQSSFRAFRAQSFREAASSLRHLDFQTDFVSLNQVEHTTKRATATRQHSGKPKRAAAARQ
jgi:hypothetical protein